MLQILNALIDITTSLGLDISIIIFIMIITYYLRRLFKPNSKIVPFIVLGLGVILGIVNIFIQEIETKNILRVICGYPGFSMLSYMLLKKYMPHKNILDTKKEGVKNETNSI
jgi:hypothetical protein